MLQISPPHAIAQLASPLIPSPSLSLFALLVSLSVWPAVTLAEVRVVTAQGEHRMGDRDTREDAIRLATEAAKRNALEQVATYLESITIVDGLDVTKDEIRTYTAGLVLVLQQDTNTTLDGDIIVVRTDLVAQIDTDEVRQSIAALRENEDARHQLVALQQENDQLQQDLDAANQALAQASTAEEAQQATQQRQDILNRVQSNAMVSQAWTDWVCDLLVSRQARAVCGTAMSTSRPSCSAFSHDSSTKRYQSCLDAAPVRAAARSSRRTASTRIQPCSASLDSSNCASTADRHRSAIHR